jgi:hypothetical protein
MSIATVMIPGPSSGLHLDRQIPQPVDPSNYFVVDGNRRVRGFALWFAPLSSAVPRYRVVKSCEPDDLLFQSLVKGGPMRDNNILVRHIKPAARVLGIGWVNWQVLPEILRDLVAYGRYRSRRPQNTHAPFPICNDSGDLRAGPTGVTPPSRREAGNLGELKLELGQKWDNRD